MSEGGAGGSPTQKTRSRRPVAPSEARTRDGNVESMEVARIVRASARSSRTKALNQTRSIVSTAPTELREELRDLSIYRLMAMFRGAPSVDYARLRRDLDAVASQEVEPRG